ncbi:hypothetical protein G6F31_019729 [Rhizopus arrhizus]|nr:hypothetical protein G6F31_019729 [Rhizopus arrhizus]
MAGRPAHHEQVPDPVGVAPALVVHVEQRTHRVRGRPRQQPSQARGRQRTRDRGGEHHPQPAHRQVQRQGRRRAARPPEFAADDDGGQQPDRHAHRGAPPVLHRPERQRRIGPGDQQVDGRMVQHVEDLLGAA